MPDAISEGAPELRGVWVATVANLDWPSRPGLPVDAQKDEARALLDLARSLHQNAIIFQVRPACDALYDSQLEPWSEFLSGEGGRAPDPPYDPLSFWIEEAHHRGLQLHAWFNPYRASHPKAKGPPAQGHIARRHPGLVRSYGPYLWLDPGEPEVQAHTHKVVLDVVRRYDIDGVHLDDYFYPYRSYGGGSDFPDEVSFAQHGEGRPRGDWRRDSVNQLVRRLRDAIHAQKPWLLFGISPFGIWRPGHPASIQGMDAYEELYADSRLWLEEGWVDYLSPQLYWPIGQKAQSFTTLLDWWLEQNRRGVHLWPGCNADRVADGSAGAISAQEIVDQILAARARPGASGHILFSIRALLENRGGLADLLRGGAYASAAPVPPSPWLGRRPQGSP